MIKCKALPCLILQTQHDLISSCLIILIDLTCSFAWSHSSHLPLFAADGRSLLDNLDLMIFKVFLKILILRYSILIHIDKLRCNFLTPRHRVHPSCVLSRPATHLCYGWRPSSAMTCRCNVNSLFRCICNVGSYIDVLPEQMVDIRCYTWLSFILISQFRRSS